MENAVRSGATVKSRWTTEGPVTLISSGRIVDQKAPWVYGRLAASLAGRVQATWIGDGPPADRTGWLEESGVDVTGWLTPTAVLDRLAASDVFVLTSKWEGMPMALIEAQMLGLPVVATNVVGNKDVITHGVNGLLADSEDDLQRLVADLVADPALRSRLGAAASVMARERFSLQRQSLSVAAAYTALTRSGPAPIDDGADGADGARPMRVAILNVYSARNRGDGLLAELALSMCREAYGDRIDVTIAAHDPESFADTVFADAGFTGDVRVISPFGSSHGAVVAVRGLVALLTRGRLGFGREFVRATREADVLASVGGAYLRGGFASELAKCMLVHGSQLAYASRLAATKPWVLLPQSIGPFRGVAHTVVARWLARATAVFFRDDKSAREFAGLTNTHRVGDSAVLAVSADSGRAATHTRGADAAGPRGDTRGAARGLILRALPDAGAYEHNARALAGGLGVGADRPVGPGWEQRRAVLRAARCRCVAVAAGGGPRRGHRGVHLGAPARCAGVDPAGGPRRPPELRTQGVRGVRRSRPG